MTTIIIGTTPTIIYKMRTVSVEDITVAILTVKNDTAVLIEKDLSDAAIVENTLQWTLTQEDTLQFSPDEDATMMLNFKLGDGTRGASKAMQIRFAENHIEEVI